MRSYSTLTAYGLLKQLHILREACKQSNVISKLRLGGRSRKEIQLCPHINLLCRSCYYQLRQLRVVSRYLSPAAASSRVHAFVVSRLDYCSAIYEGLPTCRVKCLDRVLRTAARLVGRIPILAASLGISGMSFNGSPTHSALSTASLRWLGVA